MNKMARFLGICIQGIVLGSLLFLALVTLLQMTGGARIFQYEGF